MPDHNGVVRRAAKVITIGRKRVPVEVRDALIEFALLLCPDADTEIILEYLRKNNSMSIVEELKGKNWRGVNTKKARKT
jgi:hypothetical protein